MVSNGIYNFIFHLQNDITGLLDVDGNQVVEYKYDSWGNTVGITGTLADTVGVANPFRYRGYYLDAETGMYYVSSRYYDPGLGRWINADIPDILQVDFENLAQYNLYAYCFNNPVNLSDETGTWPSWATKLAIGVGAIVVGAAVGSGTSAINHRISTGSWNGAGKAAADGAVGGAADGFMWGGVLAGATYTITAAKGIRIEKIGRLKPVNKPGGGYPGVKYQIKKPNGKYTTRSFELHSPHGGGDHSIWHWQLNIWHNNGIKNGPMVYMNPYRHWTLLGRRI